MLIHHSAGGMGKERTCSEKAEIGKQVMYALSIDTALVKMAA